MLRLAHVLIAALQVLVMIKVIKALSNASIKGVSRPITLVSQDRLRRVLQSVSLQVRACALFQCKHQWPLRTRCLEASWSKLSYLSLSSPSSPSHSLALTCFSFCVCALACVRACVCGGAGFLGRIFSSRFGPL